MSKAKNAVSKANSDKAVSKANSDKAVSKAGARRITSKAAATKQISDFVAQAALPLDALQVLDGITLLKAGTYTSFGHDNKPSMAAVIDLYLVKLVATKQLDSKQLVNDCFQAVTTTSRVQGKPANEQINATFVKMLSHLKGFNTELSHHTRFLNKRMTRAGYSQTQIKAVCNDLWRIIEPVRRDLMMGKKAAKQHFSK